MDLSVSEETDAETVPEVPSPGAARIAWCLITLGTLLRLRQYVAGRSLWLDEAMLALNIVHRSFAGLLRPLDYAQGAPIGFLWLEKLAVTLGGNTAPALRLTPLVSGIVALPLFYALARRCLPTRTALCALGLFALCTPLISYASEVKQYETDVVATLILLLSALKLEKKQQKRLQAQIEERPLQRREWALAGIVGAITLWFSHAAIFVLIGILAALVLRPQRADRRQNLLTLGPWCAVWMLSLGINYLVSLRQLAHNGTLLNYWTDAFMPWSFRALPWLLSSLVNLMHDILYVTWPPLGLILVAIGVWRLNRVHPMRLALLLGPILVVLLASAAHKYPFSGRLLLFTAPLLILLFAAGLECLLNARNRPAAIAGALLAAALYVRPLVGDARYLVHPLHKEELATVLTQLEGQWQQGDSIYVYPGAIPAFDYYIRAIGPGLPPGVEAIMGRNGRGAAQIYRQDLYALRGRPRVWLVFSHTVFFKGVDEQAYILASANAMGQCRARIVADGAAAYLYSFAR